MAEGTRNRVLLCLVSIASFTFPLSRESFNQSRLQTVLLFFSTQAYRQKDTYKLFSLIQFIRNTCPPIHAGYRLVQIKNLSITLSVSETYSSLVFVQGMSNLMRKKG